MSQTDSASLKETLFSQQQLLSKLYNELDVERESSATAASEALSMILRLQGEKAAVKMEAEQYKRLAEEKMYLAEEALAIFEDVIYQKEMLIASLDCQVQAYKYKLLSLGYVDLFGNGDTKFPDHVLPEAFFSDASANNIARRNSAPSRAVESHLKDIITRERSVIPDDLLPEIEEIHSDSGSSSLEDKPNSNINSYWDLIRKLDHRVKEITGQSHANSRRESNLPLLPPLVKQCESLMKNEATDSACSLKVHDVFEVPQSHEKSKFSKHQIKEEELYAVKGGQRLGKPDILFPLEHIKSNANKEIDNRTSDEVSVGCKSALVQHIFSASESQLKVHQLTRTGVITEIERQLETQEAIMGDGKELKLLNQIKNQLSSIQSELRSWKTKKSYHEDGLAMLSLQEAMLHFWL